MTNFIWVTLQREGFHSYPDAPDDVAFLRNKHRHLFKIKVSIEVFNKDRDIEFFQFKDSIEPIMHCSNEYGSCESIAKMIYNHISICYPKRDIKVEVSEDGENGVEFYFDKNHKV